MQIIPNGVDVDAYAGEFGPQDPASIIFSGSVGYEANFSALAFFLKDIYPRIEVQFPGVRMKITGKADPEKISHLPAFRGVEFTGYLQDVRPAIATSTVSVVPLLQGGGTRLKILEAMALGTAVVSTRKGAEGLDVKSGIHLLLADTPEDFAQAVLRILQDEPLRQFLTENAYQLVKEHYTWDSIGRVFHSFLEQTKRSWNPDVRGGR